MTFVLVCLLLLPLALYLTLVGERTARRRNPPLALLAAPVFAGGLGALFLLHGAVLPSAALALSLQVLALGASLRSLAAADLSDRLSAILLSWICLLAAAFVGSNGDHAHQLSAAYATAGSFYAIALRAVQSIEATLAEPLVIGRAKGVAAKMPKTSGIVRVSLLLLGCIPGSLLFCVEDLLVEHATHRGAVAVALVMLSMLLGSIAGYQGAVGVFYGAGAPSREPEPETTPFRAALAATIGVGLLSWFYL